MTVLVLGGTAWLGGQVAVAALERGHEVTCLARGESGAVPDGVEHVRADRTRPGAYEAVAGRSWDLVVDVSRQPGQVRTAAAALADRASAFVLVSTGNVHAEHAALGQDESAPLLRPLEGDVLEGLEAYGEAEVACEQHAVRAFGADRVLLARAGLIGGPGDASDRTGYWPLRFARPAALDGSVLVPDDPGASTQVVDVRDLAAWLVEAGARGVSGAFNATGPTVPLVEHLALARGVAGHDGPVVPADPAWLLAQGVSEWMGERSLPLWLADPAWRGSAARDSGRARAAGLVTRPLAETLADVLAWELARPDAGRLRRAGLADADERALLEALAR
jgi:nucleoside-diphosphate-sugar epimerase